MSTTATVIRSGSVEQAVERFAAGEPVLIGGLGGSDITVALSASSLNVERLGALYELRGGMMVLGLDGAVAERLNVATLRGSTRQATGLRLALPLDACDCRDGGWSLADRAHTIRVAANPSTTAEDLTFPGHVQAGVIETGALTPPAAALEIARIADAPGAVLLRPLENRFGSPLSLALARQDGRLGSLAAVPIEELWSAAAADDHFAGAVSCRLPTRFGDFEIRAAVTGPAGETIVALVHGNPAGHAHPLTSTHVACLLGDTFGSKLCDCRSRFEHDCEEIRAAGAGVIVYVKPASGDPFTCPRAGGPS
jgi:3,4-dihydroxy 2-butanone 4-phosphate synthase/GTP cyclohydrolase II